MVNITRIHKPTIQEFQQEFLYPQQPCVITGAIDDWQALSRWNMGYLKSLIGEKTVDCRVSKSDYFDNYHKHKKIKIATFLDWLAAQEDRNTWDKIFTSKQQLQYFIGSLDIKTYFTELSNDLTIPNYFDHKLLVSNNIWIGRGGNRVNLHYDFYHNFNAQIHGQKKWVIFPPQQKKFLYPHPWHTRLFWCSQVNINLPDLQKFPNFAAASPIEIIVNPGEMIFLPMGWWHSPIGIGANIAVNFWWRISWQEIYKRIFSWTIPNSKQNPFIKST